MRESRCGQWGRDTQGADSSSLLHRWSELSWPACPGDKQPESWVTSVMRNIPKQEFCLLQNHCSLCDLVWLM